MRFYESKYSFGAFTQVKHDIQGGNVLQFSKKTPLYVIVAIEVDPKSS